MLCVCLKAQSVSLSGTVADAATGKPVEFATVLLPQTEQWAVADADGRFQIGNIPSGKHVVKVSCLGYVDLEQELDLRRSAKDVVLKMSLDNLTLNTVVVTAKENESGAGTSRTIDRTALDHVQVLSVTDVSSLLPGGVTRNSNLTSAQRFSIRAGGAGESGNASFSTAVEVDGVRLSNNASFSGTQGVSTNNIASSNVESVEVISGIPSVEYGDVGSGIVKVNTKKGKTPYVVAMTSNPNTKQVSVSKGFELTRSSGKASLGTLNSSLEYTNSYSDPRSPYTSYTRRQASLTWSDFYNKGALEQMPLRLSVGVTGNIGGMNSESDPDLLANTFSTARDNSFRGNFSASWLLNKSWITNLQFDGSVNYNDRLSRTKSYIQGGFSQVALHGTEEGYNLAVPYAVDPDAPVILIPKESRYNVMCFDDKPLSWKITLKSNWSKRFGAAMNKVKAGVDWNADKNLGHGRYSEDYATSATYRPYDFSKVPSMNNIAVFAEENIGIPLGTTHLNVMAGLRSDMTVISGSAYGVTTSLSPRFNARYTVISENEHQDDFLRSLSLRAGWGVAVKQPSFEVLYPQPGYLDINVFNPDSGEDISAATGYYTIPTGLEYNSALVWQRNHSAEIGIEFDLAGNSVSLALFDNRTFRAYEFQEHYYPYSYRYTDQSSLAGVVIPVDRREYSIDRNTGVVTVSGAGYASQTLPFREKEALYARSVAVNAISPVKRMGLEWIVDFKKIRPLNTSIRVDGTFYSYDALSTIMAQYSPTDVTMTDRNPYRFVGYYVGGYGNANGMNSRSVRNNVTITTHIPQVRLIMSLKIESTLMSYSKAYSEGPDGEVRTYGIDDMSDYLPGEDGSFDNQRRMAVTYPKYYTVLGDMSTKTDFLERLKWAKTYDPDLYTNLCRLVKKTNVNHTYCDDWISPYFAANFSVTKEIGDLASISFYANNFFRNLGQIYSTKTQQYSSISGYVPSFYYGLSLRLKF